MIPARFEYVAPTSVEDALQALSEHGDEGLSATSGSPTFVTSRF